FLWPDKAETIIEEVSRPRANIRRRRRLLPGWRVPGAPKEVRDLPPRRGLRQNRRLLPPRATQARGTCGVTAEPEALKRRKRSCSPS
ncbi:unnamed protein product, partial [Ectocarpus sp. 8 AP-2014]